MQLSLESSVSKNLGALSPSYTFCIQRAHDNNGFG